jgi:mannose-1-phosphate guanylyltransferase
MFPVIRTVSVGLLAGGLGERLRATDDLPKCLIDISGTPLIVRVMRRLLDPSCSECLVVAGENESQFRGVLQDLDFGVPLKFVPHVPVLGTACALRGVATSAQAPLVLSANADTLLDVRASELADCVTRSGAAAAIAFTRRPDSPNFGSLLVNSRGLIERFDESQSFVAGNAANCGYYLFPRNSLRPLVDGQETSLEHEFLPHLISSNRVVGFDCTDRFFLDVGTPDRLRLAREIVGQGLQFNP